MNDLADDIARIAALRGTSLTAMAAKERQRRLISYETIYGLFSMNSPDSYAELRALDALPAASRALFRDIPLTASPIQYSALLRHLGDEQALIGAVRHFLPKIIAISAKLNYGPMHPQAQVE